MLHDFNAVLDAISGGVVTVNPDWVIEGVNAAAARILGLNREALQGQNFRELFDKVPKNFDQQAVTSCELERGGRRISVKVTPISGGRVIEVLDISRKAGPEISVLLTQEKSARKQAEADSALIRSILDRIGDAYIAFDAEWLYTYVNQRAAELALRPSSDLLGRCVWEVFPEAVETRFYSELQGAMRDQRPAEFVNYFAPLDKWFENSVYPSPSGVGVFYRDITDRVRTHRALENRTAELARKNAELETFAYVASHDLQEPLRMIGGYADLLSRRYSTALDADANDFIRYITSGVDRMQRLIKDLLTLCRLTEAGAAPTADLSVSQVLNVACRNLDLLIEDTGAAIVVPDLPVVRFNQTQLLQVMQNLVGNALKYRAARPPQVQVCAEREEAGWKFCVSDNGAGFDMSHGDRIFKPFNRLHRSEDGGTGIGLAICKKIIESRGGRIWAESEPGVGSKFYFTVPDALPATD